MPLLSGENPTKRFGVVVPLDDGSFAVADRGYVLESGHISPSGTADELADDERVGAAYLGG